MRNRKERRANPDQWWEVTSFGTKSRVVKVSGEQVVYLQQIGETIVVKLPPEFPTFSPEAQQQFVAGIQEALQASGIEKAVIVPDGVQFLGLRPVSHDKSKELDSKARMAARKKEQMH